MHFGRRGRKVHQLHNPRERQRRHQSPGAQGVAGGGDGVGWATGTEQGGKKGWGFSAGVTPSRGVPLATLSAGTLALNPQEACFGKQNQTSSPFSKRPSLSKGSRQPLSHPSCPDLKGVRFFSGIRISGSGRPCLALPGSVPCPGSVPFPAAAAEGRGLPDPRYCLPASLGQGLWHCYQGPREPKPAIGGLPRRAKRRDGDQCARRPRSPPWAVGSRQATTTAPGLTVLLCPRPSCALPWCSAPWCRWPSGGSTTPRR